jgi:hypothetical protein
MHSLPACMAQSQTHAQEVVCFSRQKVQQAEGSRRSAASQRHMSRTSDELPIKPVALPLVAMALRVDVRCTADLCDGQMVTLIELFGPDSKVQAAPIHESVHNVGTGGLVSRHSFQCGNCGGTCTQQRLP